MRELWLKELGASIRQARKKASLNQSELADRIGLKRTMVSHYESGKHRPSIDVIAAIVKAVGELEVLGCRICVSDLPKPRQEAPAEEQLRLDFNQTYILKVVLTLKPVQGTVYIAGQADIPKQA
jgi:transcriptional regulator with XRE-family HTH domain